MYFSVPLAKEELNILESYALRAGLAAEQWLEIQEAYTQKGRFYHSLRHLFFMFQALGEAELVWSATLSQAVLYHDFVYNPLRKDNEKKSAEYAVKVLGKQLKEGEAAQLEAWILATKDHCPRTEYLHEHLLLDADLAVLGATPEIYRSYCKEVRQEYRLVPELLYKRGRRKVLLHFLNFEHLYHTPFFRENYEKQARLNLKNELAGL